MPRSSTGVAQATDALNARLFAGIVRQTHVQSVEALSDLRIYPVRAGRAFGIRLPRRRTPSPSTLPPATPVPAEPLDADLVFAAGVMRDGDRERPVVLVDERIAPRQIVAVSQAGEAAETLERLAGDVPAGTAVIGVPAPQPFVAPGDDAYCAAKRGTLGAAVTTRTGRRGLLTAGHLGSPVGSRVSVGSQEIGTVTFSVDPIAAPVHAITPDVALIELDETVELRSTRIRIDRAGVAGGGDRITCHGAASGAKTGEISMHTPYVNVPAIRGMWADCYVTLEAISAPGDSGAPVLLEDTGTLVGHLVGGSPGYTSFVETIDVQLKATGTTLAHDERSSP